MTVKQYLLRLFHKVQNITSHSPSIRCARPCSWLLNHLTNLVNNFILEFYLLGYNAVWPLKVNRRFRGTCLHLQCRRIRHARNQHEAGSKQPKRRLTFQRTTRCYVPEDIMRSSNPTYDISVTYAMQQVMNEQSPCNEDVNYHVVPSPCDIPTALCWALVAFLVY
jgi:hypothetical protein